MNVTQHASNILEAWQFQDPSRFGSALDRALDSCARATSPSHFETERTEVLQSVIEHLRQQNSVGQFPSFSGRRGALTLLAHLSSGCPAAMTPSDVSEYAQKH